MKSKMLPIHIKNKKKPGSLFCCVGRLSYKQPNPSKLCHHMSRDHIVIRM